MFTWYSGEGLSLGGRFDRRLSLCLAFVNTSALGSFDFCHFASSDERAQWELAWQGCDCALMCPCFFFVNATSGCDMCVCLLKLMFQ